MYPLFFSLLHFILLHGILIHFEFHLLNTKILPFHAIHIFKRPFQKNSCSAISTVTNNIQIHKSQRGAFYTEMAISQLYLHPTKPCPFFSFFIHKSLPHILTHFFKNRILPFAFQNMQQAFSLQTT